MVTFRRSVDIACPPEQVFAVYADVERWPEWTASVTSVERLDHGPWGIGARNRVRQPRLPVSEWVVTELEPGRVFSWESRGPGVRTTGRHLVEARPGGCRVTAELVQGGVLGPVVALLTGGLTRRYLDLEVAGIKQRCEGPP